jgi:hypothetical protein
VLAALHACALEGTAILIRQDAAHFFVGAVMHVGGFVERSRRFYAIDPVRRCVGVDPELQAPGIAARLGLRLGGEEAEVVRLPAVPDLGLPLLAVPVPAALAGPGSA